MNSDRRWTTRHLTAALELYEQGLSARRVAEELKRRFSPAPSHEWVREQAHRAGVARTRSRAQELRNSNDNRRDYDALREAAISLVERGWTPREIAKELRVSRQFARRVCKEAGYLDELTGVEGRPGTASRTSRGMLLRLWIADLPDTRRRRTRLELVAALRLAGRSYHQIARETGVPLGSISHLLRRAGILPTRQRARRSA